MERTIELEHAGWASLCDGSGSEFYGQTMTADGLMVLANGEVMSRDDVIDALRNAPPWESYSIDGLRTIEISADVNALVYTGTGRRDDGSAFVAVMTSVYVRREDDWKLALYQQTARE